MAERSLDKKIRQSQSAVLQKRSSSSNKAVRSKMVEVRPQAKSASGPTKKPSDDFSAKEQQYKLLNAELEAKTADLVRQAEQLMRQQSEVLSKPLSNLLLTNIEDEDELRNLKPHRSSMLEPGDKVVAKKRVTSTPHNMCTGKQRKEPQCKTATPMTSHGADLTAVEDADDCFLAKTIRSMEEKMNDSVVVHEDVVDYENNAGDDVASGVSDAQIRVLKAKLRIMQEELDQLSCEYYKKDDENAKLSAKMKELEDERARLQKTTNIQQTQIEKHRALAEESDKKCDGLQLQVSALDKEIENLTRSHKQAASVHGTVEVRLNRALEEVERLKTQLNKTKQMNKDKISEEHHSKENLLAENKMLKKQKAELVVGFKKQQKLIDILKRQKMHFEAAKLLSFTEDEFMKALDWGKTLGSN
ncbi:tex9 [Pungitius sinensis]